MMDLNRDFKLVRKDCAFGKDALHLEKYTGNERRVVVPDGVVEIDMMAFYGNLAVEEVVLPVTLLSIDNGAFAECKNLKKIYLPQELLFIFESAFSGCEQLSGVVLPDTVRTVAPTAFFECNKLIGEWRAQGRCILCGGKLKKGLFKDSCERCHFRFKK